MQFTNLELFTLTSGAAILGAIGCRLYIAWQDCQQLIREFRSTLTSREIVEREIGHQRK